MMPLSHHSSNLSLIVLRTILFAIRVLLDLNPLSANPTKWPNTRKQFVGKLPTNCLSVFGHFDNLALKGLKIANTLKLLSAFAEVLIFNLWMDSL